MLIRRHWVIFFAIFSFVIILFIPVIILVFYWLANPETFAGELGNFVIIFASMYALAVLGLLLYGFVNYYLDVYIVTNKRIVDIKQNGFLRREIAELHLHQVQDVEAKVEGFFHTLMHFGDIFIQTAGERENFVFEDVPSPYTLAKEIVELHEAQIESEYEIKRRHHRTDTDDYRPEDFQRPDSGTEESEGGIKYLEEEYSRENLGVPTGEFDSGADQPKIQNKSEEKLNELSEGEEVSLDERDKEI